MAWTDAYLAHVYDELTFRCFDFYRLLVRERRGVDIAEHKDADTFLRIVKRLMREQSAGEWAKVEPGEEHESDLVLMHEIFGRGRSARLLPFHCGYVTEPGRMLDIEEFSGVQLRFFRSTTRARATQEVATRVIGVYRHEALA